MSRRTLSSLQVSFFGAASILSVSTLLLPRSTWFSEFRTDCTLSVSIDVLVGSGVVLEHWSGKLFGFVSTLLSLFAIPIKSLRNKLKFILITQVPRQYE